ncbi:thiamine/thiamine pyrophosphate ABC transporter permease [Photobacterium damselae]|uniref:thiamine/thiamine pyrophosphate ABC transporter permease n=1 Tax=Photobacterium damselae TaxID=38293 RepID=UPI0022326621|nr:thiamine/thiamine pyrophosphate ABC transporter permease [Photobacterium damselae]
MNSSRFSSTTWPGVISSGLIMAVVMGALFALISQAKDLSITVIWTDPYSRHVTAFSFKQALYSTLLSVIPAIAIAYAFSRRQFIGRALVLKLFAMTLVLPVLIAVFGLLAIYGKGGIISQWMQHFGLPAPNIYGLSGILLAHVFLNLPLSVRLLLQSLESIPIEHHQLAAHLGITGWSKFRFVAWPRLKQQLPHVVGLVFMLCFTSFAVIMSLGGGPKATTIELAIYQALRYDFDLATGAILALWQIVLCSGLVLLSHYFSQPIAIESGQNKVQPQFENGTLAKWWDGLWIGASLLLVIPPFVAVIVAGLNHEFWHLLQQAELWQAIKNSLTIASCASVIAFVFAVAIILTSRYWRLSSRLWSANTIEMLGTIILLTPGLVLSTGIFLLLRNYTDAYGAAFWVVTLVNALMALPYIIKTLSQPMLHVAQQYNQLCCSLNMSGLSRLYWVEWRLLRYPIAQAVAISFVLSLGDLGAISLFGSQDFQTLPLYLFQLMGSYQMAAASVAALILLLLSFGVFSIIEGILKPNHNAINTTTTASHKVGSTKGSSHA